MKPELDEFVSKARESLDAAEVLLLTRTLVKTDNGSASIVGSLINVQNLLHVPKILGCDGSDTPLLL